MARRKTVNYSGFKANSQTSGSEFKRVCSPVYQTILNKTQLIFKIYGHKQDDLVGYGAWFNASKPLEIQTIGPKHPQILTTYEFPNWNKIGGVWKAKTTDPIEIIIKIIPECNLSIFGETCGVIFHKHLQDSRPNLLQNMFQFSPETLFISSDDKSSSELIGVKQLNDEIEILLKACNRCGRYLPINYPMNRLRLSFGNHCVSKKCDHSTFGFLTNIENKKDILNLEYGFQLECRFCKKFEVDAVFNPRRSAALRKEDGARRRTFEILLRELYGVSPILQYRKLYGTELINDVWEKFERQCFNCGKEFLNPKQIHLDHTRPLKYLWPLDHTATPLCPFCNSQKHDLFPVEFYSTTQLKKLSSIIKLDLSDLISTQPNNNALQMLFSKLDWFYNEFLYLPQMMKERDGKIVGDLVLKALQKVVLASDQFKNYNLLQLKYKHQKTIHPQTPKGLEQFFVPISS